MTLFLPTKQGWVGGGMGDVIQISICTLLNNIYNIKEMKCSYTDIQQGLNIITGLFNWLMLRKI